MFPLPPDLQVSVIVLKASHNYDLKLTENISVIFVRGRTHIKYNEENTGFEHSFSMLRRKFVEQSAFLWSHT